MALSDSKFPASEEFQIQTKFLARIYLHFICNATIIYTSVRFSKRPDGEFQFTS